jgi:small subunit ribosomal protein S1
MPVKGTVIAKVKGGLSVDIGVKAFLPGSQIDIRPTKNLDKFIGKTMEFKVIKFNKKRGNIVLSRRAILQEERGKLRDETLRVKSKKE